MTRNIVRGTSLVFVGQFVSLVTRGGLILLLTRYLLIPSAYGRLFLTLSVLSIAVLLTTLGFPKAGARYITEYRESSPELVPVVIRNTLLYVGAAIVVVSAGIVLFHDRIATVAGDPEIGLLLLFGVGIVAFKSLKATVTTFFQGFDRMAWVAGVGIVLNVLLVVTVPGLIFLGYGLKGAVVGYVVSYAGGATLGIVVVLARFYERPDVAREARKRVSKRLRRYSVPLTFTMSANVLNSHVDKVLISVFQGPAAIAFYTLGKQISEFLVMPAHSLGFAVSPTYGAQKARDELDRAASIYETTFENVLLLYVPAATGLVLVADPAVGLIFGTDYTGAVGVVQIFSVFVVVKAVDKITNDGLDYLGRARARAVFKGVGSTANFLLNLALIPIAGVIGAATATVVTTTAVVGANVYIIDSELDLSIAKLGRTALRVGAITVVMAAVVWSIRPYATSIPSLIGVVGVGTLVWAVLAYLGGFFDAEDVRSVVASLT